MSLNEKSLLEKTYISGEEKVKRARTITIIAIALNLLLAGVKIAVSIIFGSISILADGVDSALDLVTSLLSFIAISIATRPADKDHQFGHAKYEHFFTLGIALLLVASSGMIAFQAVQRLILKEHLEFSVFNIIISASSIIVKGILVWIHIRVGKKIKSPSLVANGLNFRTDIFTSFVVLVSVSIGWIHVGDSGQTLYWVDPIIALFISVIIIYTAINITREAASVLLDKSACPETLKEIVSIAKEQEGVKGVSNIRTRTIGSDVLLVDLDILLDPKMTIEEGDIIACNVENAIQKVLPVKYLQIHVEPYDEQKCLIEYGAEANEE